MGCISATVKLDCASMRLDKYVATLEIQNVSRSRIKNALKISKINGRDSKLSAKVKNGDEIFLEWEEIVPTDVEAENIPLEILYNDENVTVVNKKQGMVTHPAAGNWHGTLVNALLHFWQNEGGTKKYDNENDNDNKFRTGIVHRLDKDTSGTIITAKNPDTEFYLQAQFRERRVKKEYIAICVGVPAQMHGNIKSQLVRDPKNRKRFVATDDKSKGKFAHTVYTCIAVYGNYSLMRLKLKTGRTHQIRVHLKSIGCPILGDPIYNKQDKLFSTATLMLHSHNLSVRLPSSEEFTTFTSPVPVRFKKVMKTLHEKFTKL